MTAPTINQDTLKKLLDYNPETGVFRWRYREDERKQWNGRYAGKVAGFAWTPSASRTACLSIRIFDWPLLGHRLAWLYMTGEWPPSIVDHKDMDGLNNRWVNLRLASRAQNGANTRVSRRNTSGFKGVSFHKPSGRYRAYIRGCNRQIWLGYHETADAAHDAYMTAAKILRGEYASAS